jgi:mRNA interferase RelE/StbE
VLTRFKESFAKDLRRLREQALLRRIRDAIEVVERAGSLAEVAQIKKLSGAGSYYRIRVGEYRIGLIVEGEAVVFVRVLHRREIYRYFP